MADPADGSVDLTLSDGFVIIGHLADLMTDLLGENTQAEPWSQNTFEDLCLPLHRKRDDPAPQLGNLGIINLGWKSHARAYLALIPHARVASWQVAQTHRLFASDLPCLVAATRVSGSAPQIDVGTPQSGHNRPRSDS